MRKFIVNRSSLIINCFAALLLLTIISYQLTITVYAVDSSPSADIKSKLEELKKEIASKAAKLKQEVNKKLKDKAYVGKVKQKSDASLTLAALSGPKIISLNQDTLFESKLKSRTKFSQKNIQLEDYIVALGDIDETAVLTAKKIILLPTPDSQLKTYLWGQVIAISDKLITIKNRDNRNVAVSLPSNQTVNLNEFVILTGINPQTGGASGTRIFDAEFVYIIPQGGFIKPKKTLPVGRQVATPSAKKK